MSTRIGHHRLRLAVGKAEEHHVEPGQVAGVHGLVDEVRIGGGERRVEVADLGPRVGVGRDQARPRCRDARRAAGAARLRCTPIPRRRQHDTPCRISYTLCISMPCEIGPAPYRADGRAAPGRRSAARTPRRADAGSDRCGRCSCQTVSATRAPAMAAPVTMPG